MSRSAPYLFCRYFIAKDDQLLTAEEQFRLFKKLRGRMIAHRKADPSPLDQDTFLMKPQSKQIEEQRVLIWHIAQHLSARERTKYDSEADEFFDEVVDTDEIKHSKIIALPDLNVFATEDRASDKNLGGKNAISRFKSIIKSRQDLKVDVQFAGGTQDLDKALSTWALEKFTFSVRPFNPTIRKMGEKLHDLMVADGIGEIRAVAKPKPDRIMQASDDGLISEAVGLTEHGYGQVAVSGTTPSGRHATLGKPKFDQDKNKNKKEQSKARVLKIYVEAQSTSSKEEKEVVRALLEFFG